MNVKRIFCIIIFFSTSYNAISQSSICGKVLDSLTLQPVPYAVITTLSSGVYCDSLGNFQMKNIQDEVLNISCMGYQRKIVSTNFNKCDTILLAPIFEELKPIILGKFQWLENNKIQVGDLVGKSKFGINVPSGLTIIKFFPNPNQLKSFIIGDFIFKLSNSTVNNPKLKARIRVFEAIDQKTVGEDILNRSDIFSIEKGADNLATINLNKYAIEMPINGCFLGIEFIGDISEKDNKAANNYLAITGWLAKSFEDGYTLRKYYSNNFLEYTFGSSQKVNLYFAINLYENK